MATLTIEFDLPEGTTEQEARKDLRAALESQLECLVYLSRSNDPFGDRSRSLTMVQAILAGVNRSK
jgi:hypothetical protein